jgi:hypothetical protein
MIKVMFYVVVLLVAAMISAVMGQRWRLDGKVEETRLTTEGAVLLEKVQRDAEAEAQIIYSAQETNGQQEAAQIVSDAKVRGRAIALEGEQKQTQLEAAGDEATFKYYLEPTYGAALAISELTRKLDAGLPPGERENVAAALYVLTKSKDQAQSALGYLRVEMTKRATNLMLNHKGSCPPPAIIGGFK